MSAPKVFVTRLASPLDGLSLELDRVLLLRNLLHFSSFQCRC